MNIHLKIGIIGDFDATKISQLKTNQGLEDSAAQLNIGITKHLVSTASITKAHLKKLELYDGIWAAPGDYANPAGALLAIEHARDNNIPFLGTWAGFQYALVEYAKNVLHLEKASHEEHDAAGATSIINKLSCSLAGAIQQLHILENTAAFSAYNSTSSEEKFQCNYGFNQRYLDNFQGQSLTFSGFDAEGNVRIVEISDSNHYLATLFLPQLSSTPDSPHPILLHYLKACLGYSTAKRSAELAAACRLP